MGSITVGELKSILNLYPDDYSAIMRINTFIDGEHKKSIAYINGIEKDDEFKEVRLMN